MPAGEKPGAAGERPENRQRIVPYLYYEDGAAALDFLCRAFGFEEKLVTKRGDGSLLHAEVGYQDNVVMLGTPLDESGQVKSHQALRELGVRHGSVMCFVENIDAHYERARAAAAEIRSELQAQDYGGRSYSAADPEGHIWHFNEPSKD